ncbi:MAG: glycosyltransferase family 2 protein [Armatimonadetes bacterium]|nr:glycosyltransferase family 2 protein [Armatimonadota bacterium]
MELQPAKSSIVIVTFNSMTTLERCVSSVLNETADSTEIIFVDNGSADGTAAFLKELATGTPRATIICNDDNLGYAAAANIGVRETCGEFVVLLNPDTVVRSGWLNQMQKVFRLPKVGAVGPLSNYTAGQQYVEFHIPKQGDNRLNYDQLHEMVRERNCGQSVGTKLIIGYCMMLSRKALEEVGLLDEELFLGCDDFDYCWRLRYHGYQLRVATDTFVEHVGHVSFKTLPAEDTQRMLAASNIAFAKKLEAQYGRGNVPTSEELFGINIFTPPYDLWPGKT